MKKRSHFILFCVFSILFSACSKSSSSNSAKALAVQDTSKAALKVQTNFNPVVGSYTGLLETESTKQCVNTGYINWPGYDSNKMEIDEFAPIFEDSIVVNITPDEDGVPRDYAFISRISDKGCGAPKLKAVCVFWNTTAHTEQHNGATLEEIGIPQPYIWSVAQDCMVNNSQPTNSYSEFIYHVINHARINDKLRLDVYLQDGSGNTSSVQSVTFFKYEKLQSPYSTSSGLN